MAGRWRGPPSPGARPSPRRKAGTPLSARRGAAPATVTVGAAIRSSGAGHWEESGSAEGGPGCGSVSGGAPAAQPKRESGGTAGDGIESAEVSCYLFDWRRLSLHRTGGAFGNDDHREGRQMNKAGISGRMAGRIGLSRSAAGDAVDAMFETVVEALAGGQDVRIASFGTFGTRDRSGRTGCNPQTGDAVSIAASIVPDFKPGDTFRDVVNVGGGGRRNGGFDAETVRPRCEDGVAARRVTPPKRNGRGQGVDARSAARLPPGW